MSNAKHLGQVPAPRGDMGIGLCYNCVMQLAAGNLERMPGFGQTLAPVPVPVAGGVGLVAVPACWDCLTQARQIADKPALLVAAGGLPR